jgi:hypothetical protein
MTKRALRCVLRNVTHIVCVRNICKGGIEEEEEKVKKEAREQQQDEEEYGWRTRVPPVRCR